MGFTILPNLAVVQAMSSKVPGKNVTVHIIAARVRMDMKVSETTVFFIHAAGG